MLVAEPVARNPKSGAGSQLLASESKKRGHVCETRIVIAKFIHNL